MTSEPAGDSRPLPDQWPCCPECQAPRIAHCPICGTVGTDFPPVDPRYVGGPRRPGESAPPRMVLCPTCDEPFVPEHANRCPWCGYQFADGYAVDVVDAEVDEPYSRRLAVSLGVAALVLALLLFLVFLH